MFGNCDLNHGRAGSPAVLQELNKGPCIIVAKQTIGFVQRSAAYSRVNGVTTRFHRSSFADLAFCRMREEKYLLPLDQSSHGSMKVRQGSPRSPGPTTALS